MLFGLLQFAVLSSQDLSNLREKEIYVEVDTIYLDSLSIVPNSEVIRHNGRILSKDHYSIDYVKGFIVPKSNAPANWKITYRVFPLSFNQKYSNRSLNVMEVEDVGLYSFYSMKDEQEEFGLFDMSGINKNGSISRGILFGNNQDLSVNSNLNLQLSGKVTEDINILAAITDDNIPIQADGNTQQLQEFDRVFIQLYNEKYKLIAGDFLLSRPNSYFMNFTKKAQGGSFSARIYDEKIKDTLNRGILESSISAAVSKGKFSRNVIEGIEGNQGPYRLTGANGEQFIIVLSGTERVFVDGKLLKRGQEFDYVIDYNTAELSFTPRFLITKDQRIVVEFQYSEQNYARSLIHSEHNYKKNKLQLNFNVFSEQDNKNQPLHQELSELEESILRDAGDDLSNAIVSGIEPIPEFKDDQVLYKLVDSLGHDSVLVFSTDPDSAKYRAGFSFVGQNNGNYIRVRSTANGKVFKWIAPVAGIPQGDHEPVIALISPKMEQMMTLNAAYGFSENTKLFVEGAISNHDLNTFSERDNDDNQSYGMKMNFIHSEKIGKDSIRSTFWNSAVQYEQIGSNFNKIEHYRDVEFERDWNIQNSQLQGNEYLLGAQTGFSKKSVFDIAYRFNSFLKGDDYRGIKNGYNLFFINKGYKLESNGSYLTADAANNSEFLRHYTTIEKQLGIFTLGAYTEQERILFYEGSSDSIINNSRNRLNYKVYLQGKDSLRNNTYRLSYSQFYDYLPFENQLINAFVSENYALEFELLGNPKSRLRGTGTYRQLQTKNEILSEEMNIQKENTLLGRLDYDLTIMKGFISSNTFYQLGSGLENKKEYSFLEVPDGQGDFIFIDFNGNGIKELDEFEEAGPNNRFEANYIKIYTPTNEFEKVYTNQFSEIIFIRPEVLWNNNTGIRKAISRFSNKATFRSDKKTSEEEDIFNPFKNDVQDSALVSINSSLSNTLYFNRLNPIFGLEFFYLNNKGKILLTNGFQSRETDQKELRARFSFSRVYTIEANVARIGKFSGSEFFAGRNYNIKSRRMEPVFIYQPSVKFRLSFNAIYEEKKNTLGEKETSINRTLGAKMELNQAGKGSVSMEVDYVNIDYSSSGNTSLSYEMLEGLQAGSNFVWNISWQRNLSNNLQLNITYYGRSSEELNTIHTGGMQVRAFF